MSTQINVTVGPLTLVEQSRQQMEANRFRQSEQEAQQRTQAVAEQARAAALALQGLATDGSPEYGNPFLSQILIDKPAAFRFAGSSTDPDGGDGGGSGGGGGDGGGDGGSGGGEIDDSTFPPHDKEVPTSPPVTGNGLDPEVGICGSDGAKSLTWFKNGTKIVTFTYINGNANVTYENPSAPRPAFLGAFDSGILAIGTGDAGNIYTSVVECNDGRVTGRKTFIEEGAINRNYAYRFFVEGEGWKDGRYISFEFPPYFEPGEIYAYNIAAGGYFIAEQNPNITKLEVIAIS